MMKRFQDCGLHPQRICLFSEKFESQHPMNLHSLFLRFSTLSIACFATVPLLASAANVAALDYSGEYLCKGNNVAVGDYEVTINLKKNRRNSTAQVAVYDLVTHTENNQSYTGQAITRGNQLAMTFKLSDAKYAEFSTGMGQFRKLAKNLWSFKNDYYEPDDTGGNYGHETCTMKVSAAKAASVKR